MWPSDRDTSRKIAGLHNIDGIIALTIQMEISIKKLDNLTQIVHMVQHPIQFYEGDGLNHTIVSCPLAFTHINLKRYIAYKNFRRGRTILNPHI